MSYLDSPRVHFSGYFQADTSTVNNDVRYYDNAGFQPKYQEFHPANEVSGAWNPEGTGVFRMVSCRVTGAQLDGRLLTTPDEDPVIGMGLENAAARVSGKLVDLDPQQQLVSEIWGLQVRLVAERHPQVLVGEYLPTAFINLWKRQRVGLPTDQTLAAVYQSILHGVQWHDLAGSRVLEMLQRVSAEGQLSIQMNLYGYGRNPSIPRFTLGHVQGTLGPYQSGEPRHFVLGRQMVALTTKGPTSPDGKVYDFQCKLHPEAHVLSADFGNCLQVVTAEGELADHGKLFLVVQRAGASDSVLKSVQPEDVALLGEVPYRRAGWYAETSGIVDFDYAHDPWLRDHIADQRLLLVTPQPDGSLAVLVQESLGGLYVRADNFVVRLEPGRTEVVELYASRFGRPLEAALALSATEGAMGGSGTGNPPLNPPVPVPRIATPADAVSYPAQITSDPATGRALLEITASAEGPGNPRGYIDGQVYGIAYALTEQPASALTNFWNYISILAFDLTPRPAQPTWYADIQPIFQQYANLYPIMSKHLLDLADYDSVVRNLPILRLAFALPRSNPNHMPVTRDLSCGRRDMILAWMDNPGPDGLPIKGEPGQARRAAAPRAVVEPVRLELSSLQVAGKTAVLMEHEARQRAGEAQS
jgi:hypothetical protein